MARSQRVLGWVGGGALVAAVGVVIGVMFVDGDDIAHGPPEARVSVPVNDRFEPEPLTTEESAPPAPTSAAPISSTPSATPASTPDVFTESFDGQPPTPQPWNAPGWDITVHSRNLDTFESLSAVDAAHSPGCDPPPATHAVTAYEDAVFQCKDHMMTAINEDGYGMIYLTPNQQVDFSAGTATVRFDVSTLRTSTRDWWDVWITPYEDNLQLPLDLGTDVDANGPPRRALRVGLGTENQIRAELYENFQEVDYDKYPGVFSPSDSWTGYETFLEPDSKRRDTFEIQLSSDHVRVGMPDYDFWWIDTDIPDLGWNSGVVQFGHHSYNPTKDCGATCGPNTWHWDNIEISQAVPFTIIPATERTADRQQPEMFFAQPAPSGAMLRFAGIGADLRVAFDGGDWMPAVGQAARGPNIEDHFASYWMPVPPGTKSVEFAGEEWYAGDWLVRDASFWSQEAPLAQ